MPSVALERRDLALAVVHDDQLARRQLLGHHLRARRAPSAAPAGACRWPRTPCRGAGRRRSRAPTPRWRPPRSAPSVSWSGQPDASAYGARVCAQRTLLDVTSRVGPYAASSGTSFAASRLPSASSGRSRSSLRHDLRARACAWRTHDQRAGAPLGRRAPRRGWPGRRCRTAGACALSQGHPRHLVDLVVDDVAADGSGRPRPGRASRTRSSSGCRWGSAGSRAACRAGPGRRSPRATSRTAATGASSPRSSLPLGKDQSSYRGRCTSSTASLRITTAPAASTSPIGREGGDMVASLTPPGAREEGWCRDLGPGPSWSSSASSWPPSWRSRRSSSWWACRSGPAAAISSGRWPAAPAGTERVSWTDWDGVRAELGSDVDARSGAGELRTFLDDAYDADLSSRSALLQSAPALQTSFGFSPASADWELFSQSEDGAVITLRMPDDTDFDDLGRPVDRARVRAPRQRRRGLGRRPGPAVRAVGEPDPRAGLRRPRPGRAPGAGLRPAALPRVGGDARPRRRRAGPRASTRSPRRWASRCRRRSTRGDYACGALAMGQADADDQAQAAELVAAAGTVDPYLAFAMGVRPRATSAWPWSSPTTTRPGPTPTAVPSWRPGPPSARAATSPTGSRCGPPAPTAPWSCSTWTPSRARTCWRPLHRPGPLRHLLVVELRLVIAASCAS